MRFPWTSPAAAALALALLPSCTGATGAVDDAGETPDAAVVDAGRTDAGTVTRDAGNADGSITPQDAGHHAHDAALPDAAAPDASTATDASMPDAAVPDAGTMPVIVEVSHDRELRGAWVATAWGINFPTTMGVNPSAQQAELSALVQSLAALNINAIFFQVRPESDAFYRSTLEPWSRFLTGTQGTDPGYDPLEYLLGEAHAAGIEVHAWMNPYRGLTNRSVNAAANHVTRTLSQHVIPYGDYAWLDPGAAPVREHILDVVEDILTRYDVDGIHFDDYFYPYPVQGETFDDSASRALYVNGGGTLSLGDWRRQNVHDLVSAVSSLVGAVKPHVRFGISPFGIYRPGTPAGITGLDAYNAIYCDPVKWMQEGWVDYLAPQLYWPTTQAAQAFGVLLDWWSALAGAGRSVFAGINLTRLGSSSAWTVEEILEQQRLVREASTHGAGGSIFYHADPLRDDPQMVATRLHDTYFQQQVLPPPVAAMRMVGVAPPRAVRAGSTVTLSHDDADNVRRWVLYRDVANAYDLQRVVPASTVSVTLEPGRWAITAEGKHGVESRGVVVDVP